MDITSLCYGTNDTFTCEEFRASHLATKDHFKRNEARSSLVHVEELSPVWLQAVLWINAELLLIKRLKIDFREIRINVRVSPTRIFKKVGDVLI